MLITLTHGKHPEHCAPPALPHTPAPVAGRDARQQHAHLRAAHARGTPAVATRGEHLGGQATRGRRVAAAGLYGHTIILSIGRLKLTCGSSSALAAEFSSAAMLNLVGVGLL